MKNLKGYFGPFFDGAADLFDLCDAASLQAPLYSSRIGFKFFLLKEGPSNIKVAPSDTTLIVYD